MEDRSPITIYTVGHSNHAQEAFLALLLRHGIEVLIDTRSAPYSRFAPHFNKDALKAAVQAAGLKYGFYGRELGGRPEGGEFYDAHGHVLYSELARSPLFLDGLARVLAGAEKYRVALLCSEEDPSVCHRRLLIARVLDEQGVGVFHVRGDGRLESERELQAAEVCLAVERQVRLKEARLAAEREAQVKEARRSERRDLREEAARRNDLRKVEAEAVRQEKQCARQVRVGQQAAVRMQRAADREEKTAQKIHNVQSSKSRLKSTQPKAQPNLFETEEA